MGTLNKILGLPDDEQQTLTQQDATNVHPAKPDTPPTIESAQPTEGISDKQRNYPSTEATTPQTTSTTSTTTTPKPSTATPTLTQQTEGSTRTHMSYVEMMKELSPYKPPTEEEIAKERRKQKRETVFAAIGDGLAAFNQAYANARGIKPVATVGMSGKVRERYEKLKRERDAQSQEYANAYIRAAQSDQQQSNWRETFDYQKERDDANDAWRKGEAARQQGNLDRQFDYQKERDEITDKFRQQQFEESKRQFNVSSSQTQQRINMESRRLSREVQKEAVTFALGTGKGTISVPTSALNASNVAYVFSKLPEDVRSTVQGEAIYDSKKRKVVGHKEPTTDAMLIAIGSNIENAPDAQAALREIAGQPKKGSDDNNTPPSRRGGNNNDTPPSRR
ncbi:MAG: hypothetical protein IJ155_04505 [Prevotella sp.]|nr:hypothetical protein [Prevotella sp.]